MNPVSPIPILVAFLVALATIRILAKYFSESLPSGRVSTIDGLRGYLAFAVFLHHAAIWFFFLRTGKWVVPPSQIYTHLGQSGVVMFFMITGFLFFSKLIDSNHSPLDWTALYVSRIFRIVPLYLFAVGGMFLIVAILSNWQLREPIESLVGGVANWLMFTLKGSPDLNGVTATSIILAGVTWTLPYEWIFYLILPLLAILVGLRPPMGYLVMGIAAFAAFKWLNLDFSLARGFIGGVVSAILVRSSHIKTIAKMKVSTLLILACFSAVLAIYPTAHSSMAVLLLSIAFTLIVGGNTLFGLLINRTSRMLGEIAYSIYLLHGILLFVVFRFVFGFATAAKLTVFEHWLVIVLCASVLISISFLTFRCIEAPVIRMAPRFVNWLRARRVSMVSIHR